MLSITSMANRYEICIVIPVFNEANTLAALIGKTQALKLVKRRSSSSTMGSTDGSAEIAMCAAQGRFTVTLGAGTGRSATMNCPMFIGSVRFQ